MSFAIADTHTHLYFSAFDPDRSAVLKRCRTHGVKLQVQIGCDEISSLAALELAKANDDMYATLGVHPCDAHSCFDPQPSHRYSGFENYSLKARDFEQLFKLFGQLYEENKDNIVAFGETGIDLYHRNEPEVFALQKESFRHHIDLCLQYEKPIVLHTRNSKQQTFDFLDEHGDKKLRGVWHCFCDGPDTASRIVEQYGFFIGVGGILTYPNAEKTREAITQVPLEYLVTETDAPFLVPQTRRAEKRRNESWYLSEVVELIAELKGVRVEETAKILFENARRLYGI